MKYIKIENDVVVNIANGEAGGYIQAIGDLTNAKIGDTIANGKIIVPPKTVDDLINESLALFNEIKDIYATYGVFIGIKNKPSPLSAKYKKQIDDKNTELNAVNKKIASMGGDVIHSYSQKASLVTVKIAQKHTLNTLSGKGWYWIHSNDTKNPNNDLGLSNKENQIISVLPQDDIFVTTQHDTWNLIAGIGSEINSIVRIENNEVFIYVRPKQTVTFTLRALGTDTIAPIEYEITLEAS